MKPAQYGHWARCAARLGRRIGRLLLWPSGLALALLLAAAPLLGLIDALAAEQTSSIRSVCLEREVEQLRAMAFESETAARASSISRIPGVFDAARRALPLIDADNAPGAIALRDAGANTANRHLPWTDDLPAARQFQGRIRTLVDEVGAAGRARGEQRTVRSARTRFGLKAAMVVSTVLLGALGLMWFRARRSLQRTRNSYERLFAGAANGMALVDADGRIARANASYARMLGFTPAELVGADFTLLKHPDERPQAHAALHELFASDDDVLRNERRYLRRDGTVVWIRSTMSRSGQTADGRRYILVDAEDVSARIQNEELLRRSAVLLQNAGRMAAIDGWFLALPAGPLQIGPHLKQLPGLDDDRPGALLACLTARARCALLHALARCRRASLAFDIVLEVDGPVPVFLRVMGQPVHGPHGLSGIEGAVQDITEQKRIQHSLRRSEQRFRAAAQVTNDGIWDWDIGAGTIWRSASIAALVGLDARDLDDTPAAWRDLIHPDDRAQVDASVEPVLQGRANAFQAEYRVRRADGRYIDVEDKACVLHGDNGELVRIIGGIRDLTERRRTQQALMGMAASVPNGDSRSFFRTLLMHLLAALGADGAAIARPEAGGRMRTLAATVDGKLLGELHYTLAGSPCAQLLSSGEVIMPDALDSTCADAAGLPGLTARAYAGRRLEAADGRPLGVLFVLFRKPVADPDGLIAVLRVFAARAGAELERMDGAVRVREQAALLDRAREAIIVLDLDLGVKFWNRGAELHYGITAARSLGRPVLSCYEEEQVAYGALAAVLEHGEWRGDTAQRRSDGSVLVVDESWTLVRDDQGAPHAILKVGSDVTEKRAAEEQIRLLAYYDTLTGLPNRRLLMDRLRQLMLRNERQGRHGALLFIDMDNFKRLNDTHGHEAGDIFLQQTAARLRAAVRAHDTVARLGGDEFVVLLDSLDAEAGIATQQARAIGATIVNAFRQPVRIGAIAHTSTASVGGVLVRGTRDGMDALLRQADAAMYQAKHGGRDAVVVMEKGVEESGAAAAVADAA